MPLHTRMRPRAMGFCILLPLGFTRGSVYSAKLGVGDGSFPDQYARARLRHGVSREGAFLHPAGAAENAMKWYGFKRWRV